METQTSKILRLPEVMATTGLSRSTVYAYMKEGAFPKPINLGVRAVGWLSSDINGWLEQKIETRRQNV